MDLEEQRLKHQIQEREDALRGKVETLKDRLERIRRLGDVKFLMGHHTGLALAGSVLAGFVARRFTGGRNRLYNSNGAYGIDSRNATRSATASPRLWEPILAIVSAMATRTAIGLIGELGKKLVPGKNRARRRSEHDLHGSRDEP